MNKIIKRKVVTFGEVMLRLATPKNTKIIQANEFEIFYGGGEANVAVSLAQLGVKSAHVTRVPKNDLGDAAKGMLQKYGVDTSSILIGGERMGLYFSEGGSGVRSSKIVYDRSHSSFAELEAEMFDWDSILENANWFHWTGITPGISSQTAECCKKALGIARKKGITISADINSRKNLWKYGQEPRDIMSNLIEDCDLIVASPQDAIELMNLNSKSTDTVESIYNEIIENYPKIKKIVSTERVSLSANYNQLSAKLYNGRELLKTNVYDIHPIVDRVGGGDAFMAGLIYGFINSMEDQKTLDFAIAASVLKHTIKGDVNLVKLDEIKAFLRGETSGRIKR